MNRAFVIITLSVTILSSSILAATDLKVSGQVRFRAEADKRSFDTAAATITPSYSRIRVGVEAVVDSNVRAFAQIQDSRVLGNVSREGEWTSGTTVNSRNIDLHQGYLELPHLLGQRIGLKLGRFEVAWDNERLMGPTDWNNVGRSWEGGAIWYRADKFSFDLNVLDARREFLIRSERSLFVVGARAYFQPYRTDLFLIDDWRLIQYNHAFYNESRTTAGLYTDQSFGPWAFELIGAYQWGTVPWVLPAAAAGTDVSAYMFQSELTYNFPLASKLRIAAGIDYASGDNYPLDDRNKAFDNLYYTSHKFRGFMDYFPDASSTSYAGLIDVYGRTRVEAFRGWTLGADFHYFHPATEPRSSYPPNFTPLKDIGWELDTSVGTTRVKGATLYGGFSIFSATDNFARMAGAFLAHDTHDLGYWGYFMATVNF